MTIRRYESLMLEIEELAKAPEKNEELLDKLTNKLAAQKYYFDNIDLDKVKESINSGDLSYNEYKILKNVIKEKKLYENNSDKIEEVINGNYENIDAEKRMVTRKSLKSAGIVAAGVLLAVGVMSCGKKPTANGDRYHKSIEDRNERFEDPNNNNNNNNDENKDNSNEKTVDNKTNNDSKSENSKNESNNDKSNETKTSDNKDDKKTNDSKNNSNKDDKKANESKNDTNENNITNSDVTNTDNTNSSSNTSDDSSSTNDNDNNETNSSENNDNNNSTVSYEVDEKKEAEIDKMIEHAGEVTYVEEPTDGKNHVDVEESTKDIDLPITTENIDADEKDVITYEIEEDNTEIIEVKPEDKEDSYTVIEGPSISLEDLPIEENEDDEITYNIFTETKEEKVETKNSVDVEEPKVEEKVIEEEINTEVKEETKVEEKTETKTEVKEEVKEEIIVEEKVAEEEKKTEVKKETTEEETKNNEETKEIVEETKEEINIEIPTGLIDLIDLVEDDENEIVYDIFEESTISKSL